MPLRILYFTGSFETTSAKRVGERERKRERNNKKK
jgi:hypothetical protein